MLKKTVATSACAIALAVVARSGAFQRAQATTNTGCVERCEVIRDSCLAEGRLLPSQCVQMYMQCARRCSVPVAH